MKRKSWFLQCVAAVAFCVVGCSTVKRAHEAQDAERAKGEGVVTQPAESLNLHGYSLERLVGFAMTNRPSVVSARLDVEAERLALKEIAADAPLMSETPWTSVQVGVNGGYSASSEGVHFGKRRMNTSGSPSASISLDLLVWDFGRYDARARAQAERVVAAERNLAEVGQDVFSDVSVAYFLYLKCAALHRVAMQNEREYADHLQRAEARLQAGEAHRLDVLKARLDLATACEETVSASNLVLTSGAQLMNALGVDASRGTCAEVFGTGADDLKIVFMGFGPTAYGIDEAFAFARTNAPSVQIARARLRAASRDIDYSVRDMLPTVSVSTGLSWVDPLWVWSWGANAVQSIFQGFRKTTAIDSAVVKLHSASVAVDEAEQKLSLELETAVANRDNAVKSVATARASLASARENLDVVRQQFEVGDASRIELSEAIASHSQALGNCVTAFYVGQTAEARLFALTGRYPQYDEKRIEVK